MTNQISQKSIDRKNTVRKSESIEKNKGLRSNKSTEKKHKFRMSGQDLTLQIICIVVIVVFCIACLMPFLLIIGGSFDKEINVTKYGYSIIPKDFSLEAYKVIFKDPTIYRAYGSTIFTTVAGTVLAMLLTVTMAYPLAQQKLKFRTPIIFFVYFTMLFGGGLVPTYLLISKYLNLSDNIWVLILPIMFSAWNMFLMRNFFAGLPGELSESAKIDGANDFQILFRIVLPISKPGIATISMFYALGYWNQWYNAMLYLGNNSRNLFPLQYLIMDLTRTTDALKEMAQYTGISVVNLPDNTLKMATTLVTIGPIVLLYPFLQKYFTQGLTVGSIKG